MATTIPITLSNLPVPTGVQAIDINQLMAIVAQYLQGSISANVSFFQQGSNWPTSDQGIFFNQTTKQFGAWSTAQGRYLPLTTLVLGDCKPSYVAGDDVVNGWVELNGRNVNAVAGITTFQLSNLEILFGVGATMPTQTFGATAGLVYIGSQ